MTTSSRVENAVFDYRALRLLVGMIALSLPIIVSSISSDPLSSISASYYTEARDIFVGLLFFVGAFLWAYNGHTLIQGYASKVAALAALLVAIAPTTCSGCNTGIASYVHYGAALALFSILTFFCFKPFRENIKGKTGKKGLRSRFYFACGWIMVGCMLGLLVANFTMPSETVKAWRIVYYLEFGALCAFGIAWIVAGKFIPLLVDEEDELNLLSKTKSESTVQVSSIQNGISSRPWSDRKKWIFAVIGGLVLFLVKEYWSELIDLFTCDEVEALFNDNCK